MVAIGQGILAAGTPPNFEKRAGRQQRWLAPLGSGTPPRPSQELMSRLEGPDRGEWGGPNLHSEKFSEPGCTSLLDQGPPGLPARTGGLCMGLPRFLFDRPGLLAYNTPCCPAERHVRRPNSKRDPPSLGHRLTAGQRSLEASIMVRIHVPQPKTPPCGGVRFLVGRPAAELNHRKIECPRGSSAGFPTVGFTVLRSGKSQEMPTPHRRLRVKSRSDL